jgi:aminopeptidase N
MKYIIYKIQIKDYIYIGSTQNFTIRKAAHKKDCNNVNRKNANLLVYRTIRDNGGWDCCSMVPIKEIEVETKTQAHIAEEAVRIEYNAQMNMIRAYRSEAIESEFQKEYRKKYQKEYQQTPEYKEYQKQYRLARKAKLADSPEIKV